jgi:hypothetical protein
MYVILGAVVGWLAYTVHDYLKRKWEYERSLGG